MRRKIGRIICIVILLVVLIIRNSNYYPEVNNYRVDQSSYIDIITGIVTETTKTTTLTSETTTRTVTTMTSETFTSIIESTTTSAAEETIIESDITENVSKENLSNEAEISLEGTTARPLETSIETKPIEEIAKEVWLGKWSTGEERKDLLTAAGYDYEEVQKEVDNLREEYVITENSSASGLTFVKTFNRGTYYSYGGARKGGSGRQLIDCSKGDGVVKGSIASSYLYKNYGYNHSGSRTKVYLEISGYYSMNGWYYLDDSDAGNSNVIDFFYISGNSCPFRNQGVVSVKCYI